MELVPVDMRVLALDSWQMEDPGGPGDRSATGMARSAGSCTYPVVQQGSGTEERWSGSKAGVLGATNTHFMVCTEQRPEQPAAVAYLHALRTVPFAKGLSERQGLRAAGDRAGIKAPSVADT